MERRTSVTHPIETSLFTPTQFQPRALLQQSMSIGWSWFAEHMVSFPRFIRDHHTGMVVAGVELRYVRPFGFFDADAFTVTLEKFRLRKSGTQFAFEVRLSADGELFAKSEVVCILVRLSEDASLSARPAPLDGPLLAMVKQHEVDPSSPPRSLPGLLADIERGPCLAEGEDHLTVRRHLCEMADQWSFIELPGYTGGSREKLIAATERPELVRGLKEPLQRFTAEFRRPLYLFDDATVQTRAYAAGDQLAFIHRLVNAGNPAHEYAVAVELF
jgi:acyl-CoA thioesterase FadM